MVNFILRFISYPDEKHNDYASYIRKYCIVEYVWWVIHRILFFAASIFVFYYSIKELNFLGGTLFTIGIRWFLLIFYIIGYMGYLVLNGSSKWFDIKTYVKRRG